MNTIPQMIPWIDADDALAVNDYMLSGGFMTEFSVNTSFESEIAKKTGSQFCVTTPNGTLSLSMALMSLGVGPGDEVIVPNYTMIATANSVKLTGAMPVFVDIELDTLWMDYREIPNKVTDKTKAIIVVAANGRYPSYGIEKIIELCKKLNLFLIEDAAQSLGSFYPNGRHIGTLGDFGSFSFSAPKIITTGQGGCLVTNNPELYSKICKIKDFGRERSGIDVHDRLGYNFKFTDLQAALGLSQINKLEKRIGLKKKIFEFYKNRLEGIRSIRFIHNDIKFTTPWFFEIVSDKRNLLHDQLLSRGIKTRKMYPPINEQKAYGVEGNFPNSKLIGEQGLWLPSFTQISEDELETVCKEIERVLL
jgi:perosamine synthetase